MMVKVEVEGVVLNLVTHSPIVILKSKKDEILPIVIGIFEAQAILMVLEKSSFPRPLTHDLIKNIIEILGGKITKVEIYSIKENIYFANLIIEYNGKTEKIDCRPSDGIALALRFGADIYADENLLEKAEIIKYYEGQDFVSSNKFNKPIDKKEAEEFRKLIENISAKDFWEKLKGEGK